MTQIDGKLAQVIHFEADEEASAEPGNGMCIGCHQSNTSHQWAASGHALAGLSCADCHKVHDPADKVLRIGTQSEVCFGCHRTQKANSLKSYAYPIHQGMTCSSCHQPHGSTTDAALKGATVNETCYSCHADLRGPFVWEHSPVSEDCMLCHDQHGSTQLDASGLGLASIWRARTLIGLGLAETASGDLAAGQACFVLLDRSPAPSEVRELSPYWRVQAYLSVGRIDEAISFARAGKAIPRSAPKPLVVPVELKRALAADRKSNAAFKALSPRRQREYVEHISEARQIATRDRRLRKVTPMIAAGVGLNEK